RQRREKGDRDEERQALRSETCEPCGHGGLLDVERGVELRGCAAIARANITATLAFLPRVAPETSSYEGRGLGVPRVWKPAEMKIGTIFAARYSSPSSRSAARWLASPAPSNQRMVGSFAAFSISIPCAKRRAHVETSSSRRRPCRCRE